MWQIRPCLLDLQPGNDTFHSNLFIYLCLAKAMSMSSNNRVWEKWEAGNILWKVWHIHSFIMNYINKHYSLFDWSSVTTSSCPFRSLDWILSVVTSGTYSYVYPLASAISSLTLAIQFCFFLYFQVTSARAYQFLWFKFFLHWPNFSAEYIFPEEGRQWVLDRGQGDFF